MKKCVGDERGDRLKAGRNVLGVGPPPPALKAKKATDLKPEVLSKIVTINGNDWLIPSLKQAANIKALRCDSIPLGVTILFIMLIHFNTDPFTPTH